MLIDLKVRSVADSDLWFHITFFSLPLMTSLLSTFSAATVILLLLDATVSCSAAAESLCLSFFLVMAIDNLDCFSFSSCITLRVPTARLLKDRIAIMTAMEITRHETNMVFG